MTVTITFILPDGTAREVGSTPGLTVLEIARQHGIPIEGACGGALACATCHVYVEGERAAALPPADEDEIDMLDLARHRTAQSRLGCQLQITPAQSGLVLRLPPGATNWI